MSHLRKAVMGRNVKRTGLNQTPQDYAPTKWSEYFDKEQVVNTENGKFHVYLKGNSGPVILCLHGGGYSALTWALFAVNINESIDCQVVAMDLRGHGNTKSNNEADLSLDTLAKDVVDVINGLFEDNIPPIVLIGHSMGGAVAVQASYLLDTVVGLCVIDVVEGTALDALSSMQSILRSRPKTFMSIQHAIQWCYKGGQTHNIEAAKVSMPGQIMNIETSNLAANECDTVQLCSAEEFAKPMRKEMASVPAAISEDDEISGESSDLGKPPLPKTAKTDSSLQVNESGPKYTWRIDLSKTESLWSGWFMGLSQKFLDSRVPKLLLLANIHGLDTALTVGQMQGKFQLQVLSKSGHAIHEDQPQQVSDIISGYLVKQKIAKAKGDFVSPMPGC